MKKPDPSHLDPSHLCVLENWKTVTRMIECYEDVENHLKELARRVCGRLYNSHARVFEQDDRIEKDGEFSMPPRCFERWKNSDSSLLALGVENISVEGLLRHLGSGDPCWFYVYSPYRADKANDTSTGQLVSIVQPPSGFELTLDSPKRGYVFTKKPSALTPEDICNAKKLEQYFTEPLDTLIKWYQANESAILKSFGASRRDKSPR